MNLIILIILIPALVCLALTLWNVISWKKVALAGVDQDIPGKKNRSVSVLIPARNEAKNLAACLESVLAQGEAVHEIIIYDDHSMDSTPQIIREYAGRHAGIQGLSAVDLPAGWCGKNFACAQLAAEADGNWLLFLDADARLRIGAVRGIIRTAEKYNATFLSCWGAFELIGFWERVLMPMLNFVVFSTYPAPLAMRRNDPSLGLAHGACLLIRSDMYKSLGGHEAVSGEIFEDVRLARHWRERGELSLCLDGQDVVSLRMYSSISEIWKGFQKNFYPAFRSDLVFFTFMALHLMVFFLPFIFLPLAFIDVIFRPLLIIALCVFTMRLALAVRFSHPLWAIFLHPLAEGILLAIGLSSYWKCKTGRGVQWKDRTYHDGSSANEPKMIHTK